jgi:hypothetical protein
MFRSSLLPDMNSQAENTLMTTPMPATTDTVMPATGGGLEKRCTASHAMAPQASISSRALSRAATIDELRRP